MGEIPLLPRAAPPSRSAPAPGRRALLRLAGALGIALLGAGCGAGGLGPFAPRAVPCLTGPVPVVGRAHADASYAVLRHRFDALPHLHPLAQAALWPTLESWVPDVSDRVPEPACDREIAEVAARALAGPRVPPERAAPVQPPAPGGAFMTMTILALEDMARSAARAVLQRAADVAATPDGAAWLEDLARADARGDGQSAEAARAGEVLLERWAATDRDRAVDLVRRWMKATETSLAQRPPTNLAAYERFAARQYAVARWASVLGLEAEAARSFTRARASIGPWASSLADGSAELDAIFAVCLRLVTLEPAR